MGMGLRRFSEDVATAARLSSAALAHAALAGGCDKALPFRGAMGLEVHSSLARLQEAWPTVKGLADRPDDAAERAGRNPDGKALRMAALQRAIFQADADARTAALFAPLEADAKGASSQVRSAALADLARLRSCAGSLASAWLTARPGPAELTAVVICISARLRLGEDFSQVKTETMRVSAADPWQPAAPTPSYGALWHTVVARHNALTAVLISKCLCCCCADEPGCASHWAALAERIWHLPFWVCAMIAAGGCCAGGVHDCCAGPFFHCVASPFHSFVTTIAVLVGVMRLVSWAPLSMVPAAWPVSCANGG